MTDADSNLVPTEQPISPPAQVPELEAARREFLIELGVWIFEGVA